MGARPHVSLERGWRDTQVSLQIALNDQFRCSSSLRLTIGLESFTIASFSD